MIDYDEAAAHFAPLGRWDRCETAGIGLLSSHAAMRVERTLVCMRHLFVEPVVDMLVAQRWVLGTLTQAGAFGTALRKMA